MVPPSEQPKVGEYGTVVKVHCDPKADPAYGIVVRVVEVVGPDPTKCLRCLVCGKQYDSGGVHAGLHGRDLYHPLNWIKRLPPVDQVIGYDFIRADGLKVRTPEEARKVLKRIGFEKVVIK